MAFFFLQHPDNGKKARTERRESGRPWFAEIVDDSGVCWCVCVCVFVVFVCVCVCVCVHIYYTRLIYIYIYILIYIHIHTGKRTKVPCKYDADKCMYVPTGGRDVVPGSKVCMYVCVRVWC